MVSLGADTSLGGGARSGPSGRKDVALMDPAEAVLGHQLGIWTNDLFQVQLPLVQIHGSPAVRHIMSAAPLDRR